MDHAPAPSWLDSHLDSRPGWADAPADGVVIDPAAVVPESPLDEPAAPAGESWLDDATIGGMVDEVDQIEITDADLAPDDGVDDEFALPPEPVGDTELSLVDPFDEFVAETETTTATLPDPDVHDEIDDDAGDIQDDIAPASADTVHPDPDDTRDDTRDDATGVEVTPVSDDTNAPGDGGYDAFDSFGDADAVADGVGDLDEAWATEAADDAPADTGHDAFDDLDEGTDG